MLYLVGIGVHDEMDISLKGIDACKKSRAVFAEFYTSPIPVNLEALQEIIGKEISLLDRRQVEEANILIESAKKGDTAFLVGGDPLSATTHADIVLEARHAGVNVGIIHSSSVFSAIAESGMHLYKFGRTVSLPQPQENYFPVSPYDNILENKNAGLHTLLLLDIGMTANRAIGLLLELEGKQKKNLFSNEAKIVVCAHLGGNSMIKYGPMAGLAKLEFGGHPHCIIIPGELHFHEEEFLGFFK